MADIHVHPRRSFSKQKGDYCSHRHTEAYFALAICVARFKVRSTHHSLIPEGGVGIFGFAVLAIF